MAVLQVKERVVQAVEEIREVMATIYRVFENDSEEVQREWVKYTQKVDKKMEEALRYTVKKSLQVSKRGGSLGVCCASQKGGLMASNPASIPPPATCPDHDANTSTPHTRSS